MNKAVRIGLQVVGGLVAVAAVGAGLFGAYVAYALPDAGPVPDIKVEITPERVARGEYLAKHVAMCMHCHTGGVSPTVVGGYPPGDQRWGAGGAHFGRDLGLPGDIYARNITPAGIGDWTDGEIFHAITTGIARDGHTIFPMMNYKGYGKSSQEDMVAIVAYLRSLPPIENEVPKSTLDMPLPIVFQFIPEPATLTEHAPDRSDPVAYGKYLVTIAGCHECHTKSEKGVPEPGMDFAGGAEFASPVYGTVRTSNLTPDPTGLGGWTEEMFIARFRMPIPNAGATVVPGDFFTPMPWEDFSGMTDEDLHAIWSYLRTVAPVRHTFQRFTPPATASTDG